MHKRGITIEIPNRRFFCPFLVGFKGRLEHNLKIIWPKDTEDEVTIKAICYVAYLDCGGQASVLSHPKLNSILGSDPDLYWGRK